MKSTAIPDYLAWIIVFSPVLLVIVAIIGGFTAVDNSVSVGLIIAVTAMFRAASLLYPLAVLHSRIKSGSYTFLKKVVHYIALPLCLLVLFFAFT